MSPVCARRGLFSAEAAVAVWTENGKMKKQQQTADSQTPDAEEARVRIVDDDDASTTMFKPTGCEQPSGVAKENPPCTPLKENRGRSLNSTDPDPVPIARTYAPAQGTPPGQRTETGTVKTGVFGTGTETAPRRRPLVDAKFILDGYNAQGRRYDAVQTAMVALDIPPVSNGRNNARILRYYVDAFGEDYFRQLIYDKWREDGVDGKPDNSTTALMSKLYYTLNGGAR